MEDKFIILLDIGSYSLKALSVKTNGGTKSIVDSVKIPSKGVSLGVIDNIEECSATIKEAFRQMGVEQDDHIILSVSNPYVQQIETIQKKYIPPEQRKVLQTDLDELEEKAQGVYMQENTAMVEVFLKYYKLDDRILQSPKGMEGDKLESIYNIFTCPKRILDDFEQCLNEAGYSVGQFSFSPRHMIDVLKNEAETTLLLDFGADNTRASYFKGDILQHSFALPFGGSSITLDIKNSYPLSMEQAEELKCRFGFALIDEAEKNAIVSFNAAGGVRKTLRITDLAMVTQSRFDEILRAICFHMNNLKINQVNNIILTGEAQLQSIEKNIIKKIETNSIGKAIINDTKTVFKDLSPSINKECLFLYGMINSMEEEVVEEKEVSSDFISKSFSKVGNILGSIFKKSKDSEMD